MIIVLGDYDYVAFKVLILITIVLSAFISHVDEIAEGLEKAFSIPAFTFKHLGLVKTHAIADATLSDEENTYPVLLFSHGLTGFRNQNTFEVEELASHGYIVVGIDHAYNAVATVYPDGRTAYLKSPNLTESEWDDHIQLWMVDVDFVLNQIEKLNQEDEKGLSTRHLNTSRIGMFGHSYGGATATQMLAKDARIKAAINMYGT
ncbi:alpha/beta fold hydrolase [Bacillus sp. Bva_UNVM-123]